MGDSSVSCVLTGVSLHDTDAVLIPLAPSVHRRQRVFSGGAREISNEGAAAIFSPLTLPLFGVVGSYGDFESIERNANTEFLESALEMKIEEFSQAVSIGAKLDFYRKMCRREANFQYDKPFLKYDGMVYGCWVAREAWDHFSTHALNEDGSNAYSVYDEGWLNPFNLLGMGFERGKKDVEAAKAALGEKADYKRYHTPYTHPFALELTVWCDENMSSEVIFKGKPKAGIYHVAQLQKMLESHKRSLSPAALKWAKETSSYASAMDEARREYLDSKKNHRRHQALMEKDPQFSFDMIADNTLEEDNARMTKIIHARIDRFLKKGVTPAKEPESLDSAQEIEQTFCDGEFHVIVKADHLFADAASNACSRCPKDKTCTTILGGHPIHFTPETIAMLTEAGWVPKKKQNFLYTGLSNPYLRQLAPEFVNTYKLKMFDFNAELCALYTFMLNMHGANRFLQPTNSGYQYGHPALQIEVASMARRLAQFALDRRG